MVILEPSSRTAWAVLRTGAGTAQRAL